MHGGRVCVRAHSQCRPCAQRTVFKGVLLSMGNTSRRARGTHMNGPIVVGTDGSDTAKRAVAAAITLAKTFAQPLHIVSAYQPQPSGAAVNVPHEYRDTIFPHSKVEAILA